MWSRYMAEGNLVALFIVGMNYFVYNVDVKLLIARFELSDTLILKSPAKITSLLFFTNENSHMPPSCSVKSIIAPQCGR